LEREANWVALIVNSMPFRGQHQLRVEQMIGMSEEQLEELERERERRREAQSPKST
jgi:hypothetical protein